MFWKIGLPIYLEELFIYTHMKNSLTKHNLQIWHWHCKLFFFFFFFFKSALIAFWKWALQMICYVMYLFRLCYVWSVQSWYNCIVHYGRSREISNYTTFKHNYLTNRQVDSLIGQLVLHKRTQWLLFLPVASDSIPSARVCVDGARPVAPPGSNLWNYSLCYII